MPPPSEAALRYAVIDKCLTNLYKPYPNMDDLKWAIERELKTSVSTATIQKDIAQMKKSEEEGGYSAPIIFKRSRLGYAYDLEKYPDYTIRSFGLNDKEIEAIELAAGVLQHFKGIKINDTFNHAIDKLFSSVDIKKNDKNGSLLNAIQTEETTYMRGMEHFEAFVNSIKKKIPLSFIHYSYSKKLFKAIVIHPYLLKESNKRWYLIGYSEDHKAIRYFGLDRIYDPVLIEKLFIENTGNDLRNLFSHKIGLNTIQEDDLDLQPEEIVLLVSKTMANYLKSMPLHKSQSYKEHGGQGDILVSLQLIPTYELIALILSYGENMELISPKWLRSAVEKELERSINKYRGK
jgi:predicted DNA-binding transcriptional regulator YafY